MQKKKFKITKLSKLYNIKNLILISIEYENILNVDKFDTKELFNFILAYYPNSEDVTRIFIKFIMVKKIQE